MRLPGFRRDQPRASATPENPRFVDVRKRQSGPRSMASSSRPAASLPTESAATWAQRTADAALAGAGDHRALMLQQISLQHPSRD